jgi:hypothetical protein
MGSGIRAAGVCSSRRYCPTRTVTGRAIPADDKHAGSCVRVPMAETEGEMAGLSAQQLLACVHSAAGCICSQPLADEPAGQQSVREAQLAQAIAGWTLPRRHARTTIEAISRRNTTATSGPIH